LKIVILIAALVATVSGSDWKVYRAGEIDEIIGRMIWHESRSNAESVNGDEHSVGLMQVTRIARVEFNAWTGKDYNYWTMFKPESNVECGSYILTNILLRYRTLGNIVQAVAAYNVGIKNVFDGYYPEDYCRATIPWYWAKWCVENKIIERWRDKGCGAWIVKMAGKDGKAPRLGL